MITLLTDFGLQDGYAAAMKGVIDNISPQANIVDISHQIEPQNLAAAAFLLHAHFRFFPKETIHVAVVDPGVGSERKIILARAAGHLFLAPDNGLLTFLRQIDGAEFFEVINKDFWLPEVSRTFHGRDIFAPVAAHLANGVSIQEIARPIDGIVCFEKARPRKSGGTITGKIEYVDRFGNLVSSISISDAQDGFPDAEVWFGNDCLGRPVRAYVEKKHGEALAVWGSFQRLEIAVNGGSAKEMFPDYEKREVNFISARN